MSENTHPAVPAAAIRPGIKVGYIVQVDGKEILSRGEVFGFRRVGHDQAEITLLHAKTGSLFTNVVAAATPVVLTGVTLDPKAPEADTLTMLLVNTLTETMKQQASDFYSVLPIED